MIGGAVTVPAWFINGYHKAMTVLDNILLKIVPKNDEQKRMITDARAFIDGIYTAIADGKLTIAEIKESVGRAKTLVQDIQNYHIPIPAVAPSADPTVMEMLKALQAEIVALKNPPKVA